MVKQVNTTQSGPTGSHRSVITQPGAVSKVKKGQKTGDKPDSTQEKSPLLARVNAMREQSARDRSIEQIEEVLSPETKFLHKMEHYALTLKGLSDSTADERTPKERLRNFHANNLSFEQEYQKAKDEKKDGDWAMATAIGTIKEALRELGGDQNRQTRCRTQHKKIRAYGNTNADKRIID